MTTNTNKPTSKNARRKRFNSFVKVSRKLHMYLGLLLVPWVLLFGTSGFLFNHNSTFWGGSVKPLASIDGSSTSLSPINLEQEVARVLETINADGASYSLAGDPWLSGHLKLTGKSNKDSLNLTLNPTTLALDITTQERSSPDQTVASFNKQSIANPSLTLDSLNEALAPILAANDLPLSSELEFPSRGSNAEIRFFLTDEQGTLWRASYNLATATLSGVSDDSESGYNLATAMTRLHKTHHYPDTFGARWLWSVIGDITAISLVIWGLTGLIMWWQIKPSRVLGALSIFGAAIVAFFIFSGTLDDYTHNPVEIRGR